MLLEVNTHDGEHYVKEVEDYDAVTLNEQANNPDLNTVVIGDLVISRINLKSVNPFVPSSV